MNKLVTLLALAATLACGDYEETPPDSPTGLLPAEVVQYGKLRQPLTVTNGYGVLMNGQSRCNGTVNGCIIPTSKVYKLHNKTGNCTGTASTVIKNQVASALGSVKTILENRGFTVTLDTANYTPIPSQGYVDIDVRCGGTTPLGGTIDYAGTVPTCATSGQNPPGYCRLYYAVVYIDPTDIATLLAKTADTLKQNKVVYGIALHEIGHGLTFGHGPTCTGTQVMCNAASFDLNDPNTWGNRSYTNEEKGWLQSFVP